MPPKSKIVFPRPLESAGHRQALARRQDGLRGFGQELAAINNERLAGDISGLGGGEEGRGIANIAGAAKPVQRDGARHFIEVVLALRFEAFGEDISGQNAIDGDAIAGDF